MPARRFPAVLVWVPLALLSGAAGALLSALAPRLAATSAPAAWIIGRALLAQGFVAGLVLGVGGILVPQLTRGEGIPDVRDRARLATRPCCTRSPRSCSSGHSRSRCSSTRGSG